MIQTISREEARRIALAGGLDRARLTQQSAQADGAVTERLGLHQIDSVEVLVRAHYLPLFSRLSDYPQTELDRAAWGRKPRRLFECWAYEASLLPLQYHPLLRWRMARRSG